MFFPKANTLFSPNPMRVMRQYQGCSPIHMTKNGDLQEHLVLLHRRLSFSTFIMVLHENLKMQTIQIAVREGIKTTKKAFLSSCSKFTANLSCLALQVLYILFSHHKLNV